MLWRTRPQYVFRSYWEDGRSLLPGSEDDMLVGESAIRLWAAQLTAALPTQLERVVYGTQWLTAQTSMGEGQAPPIR